MNCGLSFNSPLAVFFCSSPDEEETCLGAGLIATSNNLSCRSDFPNTY